MEKRSAIEWLNKYAGDESCRIVWKPLLKMKFGDNYDRISAAWLWNRVVDRKKAKASGGGQGSLGYIRTGYKVLFDALVKTVRDQGGEILTGVTVEDIPVVHGRSARIR